MTRERILITGAGVGGLALGQGLLKAGIPFRIFERDPALNFRPQGYRFRVDGPGVDALSEILLPELLARVRATSATIAKNGPKLDALTGKERETQIWQGRQQAGSGSETLSLDRSVLRNQLFRGLEEHVEFGKEISSYDVESPSGVVARFTDGSEASGALLAGADGIHSRVCRQFLPDRVLLDTEGRCFFGKTILSPELLARFHEKALTGMTLIQEVSHDDKGSPKMTLLLEAIRFKENEFRGDLPQDYIYWVLIARKDVLITNSNFPADLIDDKALLSLSNTEAAALCEKLTAHWHPSFHALFALQPVPSQTSILRVLTSPPVLPAWEPSNRVTFVGDAAHPMSPTSASGAKTALMDAATLTQVLSEDGSLKSGEGVSLEALARYKELMKEYAEAAIKTGIFGGSMLFGMAEFDQLKPVTLL